MIKETMILCTLKILLNIALFESGLMTPVWEQKPIDKQINFVIDTGYDLK